MQTLTIPLREGGFTVIYWYGETGKYFNEDIGFVPVNKTVIYDRKRSKYVALTDKSILKRVGGWSKKEIAEIKAKLKC